MDTDSVRTAKPTIAQYNYLLSLERHQANGSVGTTIACESRGWVIRQTHYEDTGIYPVVSYALTDAGRQVLAAGLPVLSARALRTKARRAAENGVRRMLDSGAGLTELAEALGTSVHRLVELDEAARKRRR